MVLVSPKHMVLPPYATLRERFFLCNIFSSFFLTDQEGSSVPFHFHRKSCHGSEVAKNWDSESKLLSEKPTYFL